MNNATTRRMRAKYALERTPSGGSRRPAGASDIYQLCSMVEHAIELLDWIEASTPDNDRAGEIRRRRFIGNIL